MTLGASARECSQNVWEKIELALGFGRTLKEQTLTDLLLLDMSILMFGSVEIVDITQQQENVLGADWEWWFIDQAGRGLPFRVQAKVMDMRGSKRNPPDVDPQYKMLHYGAGGAPGNQTQILISRSEVDHMLPLYCLYTHYKPSSWVSAKTGCKSNRLGDHPAYGVSLIGPHEVAATASTRLSNLFDKVHTLDCLFFFAPYLELVQDHFLDLWRVNDAGQGLDFIREAADLPSHVAALLNARSNEEELALDFALPDGTGRVTLFVIGG